MPLSIPDTAAGAASKATGTGSAVTVVSAMASFDIGFWIGLAIGLAGLGMNYYFRRRDDRRKAKVHELLVQHIQSGQHKPVQCPSCDDNQ